VSSPIRWNGSRGQVRPENCQNQNINLYFDYLFQAIRGYCSCQKGPVFAKQLRARFRARAPGALGLRVYPGPARQTSAPMTSKTRLLKDDGHANQGSGHLQPGFRLEPEIVYIWGLNGTDRPTNPSKQLEGQALHLFGAVWRSTGPDPKYKRFSAPA
jgi:hypothetical protein